MLEPARTAGDYGKAFLWNATFEIALDFALDEIG